MVVDYGVEEYRKGLEAIKQSQFEDAVQLLGQGLQALTEKYGEESLESAGAYYQYGRALFYRAQEESDVLGATLRTAVDKHDEGPSTAVNAREGGDAENGNGAQSGSESEEGGGEDDGDEQEEEEGDPSDDDMQLAWENLEVARRIYVQHEATHARELADVHILLADLATEQESFEEALADYQRAQTLLRPILKECMQASDRQLAELHFKTGLAFHFLNQPAQGLAEVQKAIAVLEAALKDLADGKDTGDGSFESELQAVLSELRAKEEELEDSVKEVESTKSTLTAAFQNIIARTPAGATPGAASAGPSQVVDLGIVGQGKKRINLAPIPAAADAAKENNAQEASKSRPKRSLEDLMGGSESTEGFAALLPAGKRQGAAVEGKKLEAADAAAAISTNPVAKSVVDQIQEQPKPGGTTQS